MGHDSYRGEQDLALVLRQLAVFDLLTDAHLAAVAELARWQRFSDEQVIYGQGEHAKELGVVLNGEIEARLETPLGAQRAAILGVGDLVGEISLIDGLPRSSSVVAVDSCELVFFGLEELHRLQTSDQLLESCLLRTFCRSLAGKIRQANCAMTQIMAPDADTRTLTPEHRGARTGIDEQTTARLLREHGISDMEMEVLLQHFDAERYEVGEEVFAEGSLGDRLYIVAEGQVRISRRIPGMGEEALAFLSAGEIFGEMAWIDQSPRSADAIVHRAPCTVIGMSRQLLEEESYESTRAGIQLLKAVCQLLSRRIRRMNTQLVAWRTMAFYG